MTNTQLAPVHTSPNGKARRPRADAIVVEALTKTYQVPEREPGLKAAVGSFFHRKYRQVPAVQQVNFNIAPGEIGALFGSTDHLECAAHAASAAEQLGVAVGDPVELRRA